MHELRRRALSPLAALPLLLGLVGADGSCERQPPVRSVYGLTDDSVFSEGCFPPLTCPTPLSDLGGTFRLELVEVGDLFDRYAVRDVFWLARVGGEDVPITGAGSYRDGLLQDRLVLDLVVGDEDPQRFDSGFVPSGPLGSPEIDITISINGERGLDTVIDVRAVRLPASGRTPCGPTGLTCDAASEICVATSSVGPALRYGCEPVPSGCEADRSCDCAGRALCEAPADVCTQQGENQLLCQCPLCF